MAKFMMLFALVSCAVASASAYGYSAPAQTYKPQPTYVAPTYVQPMTYAAPEYEDSYESPSYYSNYYAPIYSINSNPQKGNNHHNNPQNNNIIRNSYDSSYGYQKDGYGKGSPYYSSNYNSCVQNNNNNQNRRNRQGLGNLAGLLGGCSNLGGHHGGHY